MKKRTSAFARIFAVLALAAAVAAVLVVVSGAFEDDTRPQGRNGAAQQQQQAKQKADRPELKAATYEVKPGDTLTRISARSGVPVQELIALNPEVDPQILIAGETLKLR